MREVTVETCMGDVTMQVGDGDNGPLPPGVQLSDSDPARHRAPQAVRRPPTVPVVTSEESGGGDDDTG